MKIRPEDALEYHSVAPAGKLSVTPTKPCRTQRDLSLAYTPGVAVPCLEIERDPSLAYKYTAKGNLVGGRQQRYRRARPGQYRRPRRQARHGRQGRPLQALRRYRRLRHRARHARMPEEIIRTCQILEPTFGGINLEDIKAPECFYIEEDAAEDHEDPGLPRRSARHRDHLRRRPAQRPRTRRQEHRRDQGGLQRRRRQRHLLRRALRATSASASRTSSCATPRA